MLGLIQVDVGELLRSTLKLGTDGSHWAMAIAPELMQNSMATVRVVERRVMAAGMFNPCIRSAPGKGDNGFGPSFGTYPAAVLARRSLRIAEKMTRGRWGSLTLWTRPGRSRLRDGKDRLGMISGEMKQPWKS